MDDECTSLGDLLGDDGGGVKGRVNSFDPLVLNRFLEKQKKLNKLMFYHLKPALHKFMILTVLTNLSPSVDTTCLHAITF